MPFDLDCRDADYRRCPDRPKTSIGDTEKKITRDLVQIRVTVAPDSKTDIDARLYAPYLDLTMTTQAKALRIKINHLRAELEGCTTAAQRRCVTETIIDAERQLTELG